MLDYQRCNVDGHTFIYILVSKPLYNQMHTDTKTFIHSR